MVDMSDFLKHTNDASIAAFRGQRRITSFLQYLDTFCANPVKLGRNAPQYILDMFKHFGTRKVDSIGGKSTRFNVFDAPFDGGRDALQGQEGVQLELLRHLRRFAVTGSADKLVLVHGPNGSGKSTIIDLIVRALEKYSTLDEGLLFRFNWVFTEKPEGSKSMGFSGGRDELPKETLAFIDEALISCKLGSELREPPLFLVPIEHRARLLDQLIAEKPDDEVIAERLNSPFLRDGKLSAKNKLIFDALMTSFRGDWLKVVRHVQVERYFISKRYRTGASVIEPQQAVDAHVRPTTFEQTVSLPTVLQGLPLVDMAGELIEASAGIVEYSDFLKRNLELNKYLLSTVERGEVSLPGLVAPLNLVMLGTCNEKQLSAFKQTPDFTSYKGRIELVRSPYLLEWRKELAVYEPFIAEIRETRHVAPHTIEVAALWAILTRLRHPDPGKYPAELSGVIRRLTPLDKARLYDNGEVPEGITTEEKRLLRANIVQLRDEHRDAVAEFEGFVCAAYEGRRGASAREMQSLLSEAANLSERKFVSPLAVFESLEKLLNDKSVYDFLRIEAEEGYHDCEYFIEEVKKEYFRWVSVEVYDSMGLVEESEYDKRVEDYFKHVRAYVAKEKIQNSRTGSFDDPSVDVLEGLEKLLPMKESADTFRKNLITRVAAYSLEHPNEKLDYHEIFADIFQNMRESFYREKEKALIQIAQNVLLLGGDDEKLVTGSDRPRAERTLEVMRNKYQYNNESAREAISFVLRTIREKA